MRTVLRKALRVFAMCGILAGVLCFSVVFAQAKSEITNATFDQKLTNVRKAKREKGKWVDRANGTRFLLDDTKKPVKDRWIRQGDDVYYLNKAGYRASGWVRYGEHLYFLKGNGKMVTGWRETKEKHTRRYFKPSGKMATGLTEIDGDRYYFDEKTGAMKTGWVTIGNGTYFFGSGGRMKTSRWVWYNKQYYYVGSNGKKASPGWLTLGKKKYYLDENGARVKGKIHIGNDGYYFKKNGEYDPKVKVKPLIDVNKKMVALTFDDGPGRYTDRLLNCLQANGAKATFFMVGSSVPSYKSTVQRMVSMGCELGNHSYSHPTFTTISASRRAWEVNTTKNNIYAAAGQYPTVFRLPYGDGANNASVLASLGLPSIYWSVDTRDWANKSNPQHTVDAALGRVQNGSIILMHDIHYSTVVAAERIIPELRRRGYQMVTVSELAKYKGNTTMQAGRTYRSF